VVEESKADEHVARPSLITQSKPGEVKKFSSLKPDTKTPRKPSGLEPIDRVLSGGFVNGSVTLLAGEPGIGKSTLLAQAAMKLAKNGSSVLCVTGEESPSQVVLRLKRISRSIPENLSFLDATDANVVAATIRDTKPNLTIVDSIQSMITTEVPGGAGSISQTKASAGIITESAKRSNVPVILVGQVNKEGEIAGPRLLEHLVDTVLMLEGDKDHRFRILRVLKNRFGATDEVAVLTMTENGLESIDDPSAELLKERPQQTSGSIISCIMEGHRPILIELQALVTPAGYGTPVRRTTGIDSSRLGLLLAVLARRAGVRVLDKDVYANAAGGLKAREPAIDLGLCIAISSAVSDITIDAKTVAFGEVGLGGEVRPVPYPELRIKECERHGFRRVIVPKGTKAKAGNIHVVEISNLREAIDQSIAST
jgi:DNA repair protein RadA/Sms